MHEKFYNYVCDIFLNIIRILTEYDYALIDIKLWYTYQDAVG